MATYSRSSNLPATTSQSQVPSTTSASSVSQMGSKELGSILIRSLETVQQALDGGDVPVNAEQIEQAVTKGINKSVIAKGMGKGGVVAQSGSAADKALANYWEQKKYNEWKKEQDRQKKLDDEERKRREDNWNKKVDEAFQNINSFSKNPLKGFSDMLDKGVKGLFKGVGHTMDKSFGEIGKDVKDGFGKALAPAKAVGTLVGSGLGAAKSGVIAGAAGVSAIRDRIAGGKVATGQATESGATMGDLIESDNEKQLEKEEQQQEVQQEQSEKMGELVEEQKKSNKLAELKFGLVIAGIAGVVAAIPAIAGAILPVINNIPTYLKDAGVKVAALISGPNSVGNQIKLTLQQTLASLADSNNPIVAALGKPFAYGASAELKEEQAAKQAIANEKLNASGASEAMHNLTKDVGAKNASLSSWSKDSASFAKNMSKTDKKKYDSLKKKPLKNWTDDDIKWLEERLPTDQFQQFQKIHDAALALAELSDVYEKVKADKGTKRDFAAERAAMAEAGAEYESEKKAEWRLNALEEGKLSAYDLRTDKEWGNNAELQAAIQSKPELLSNLRQENYFEKLGNAGMDYNEAWGKTLKDTLHDVFGYDIKEKQTGVNLTVGSSNVAPALAN